MLHQMQPCLYRDYREEPTKESWLAITPFPFASLRHPPKSSQRRALALNLRAEIQVQGTVIGQIQNGTQWIKVAAKGPHRQTFWCPVARASKRSNRHSFEYTALIVSKIDIHSDIVRDGVPYSNVGYSLIGRDLLDIVNRRDQKRVSVTGEVYSLS